MSMVTSTDIKAIHERLRGAPRHTNLIAEKKRRERIQALEDERERAQAAAREAAWIEEQRRARLEKLRAQQTGVKIDIAAFSLDCVATARFAQQRYVNEVLAGILPMETIANLVLLRYPGTTMAHVRAERKDDFIVEVRREIVKAIKASDPAVSLVALGVFLNRHHSTILNMLRGKKRK